ncbi:MAG TPA: isochorismatase family cysteine hydrolase [Acetobacteraceae bacterium]|nr:isochorismatase family cysteine hydrolase [Acetobacteraceae bacterium]
MPLPESPNPSSDRLVPDHTALLVIDVQRYFVHPDYPFGKWVAAMVPGGIDSYFRRVRDFVIPNVQRLLERARQRRLFIVFTEAGSLRPDGSDLPRWMRRHIAMSGAAVYPPFSDPSCRVDDRVAPRPGELILQKTTSGPLNSTKLDQKLRVLGIDTVIVTGVVTDVCVAQTAREFGDRDFDAIVVEDACASTDEGLHKAALETIAMTFGFVESTEQVLARL